MRNESLSDQGSTPCGLKRMATAALRVAFVLMATFIVGASMSNANANESADLALDARLPLHEGITHHGVLRNGMRYLIYPHKMPADRVEMVMRIGTGSVNETERERGLAHYLEHMAFNGSEHYPAGSLVKTFESHGMKFGRDQNAFTSFDQTTYLLSLPNTAPKTLDMCFTFFADVGSRLTIPKKEVEKERGVILEEERMRDTVSQRIIQRIAKALAPGSRFSERFPIGLTQVIRETTPEHLRGYYERCYRPDVTTLIVVGDVDGATIEARIKKAFSGWLRPHAAKSQMAAEIESSDTFQVRVMTDPDVTQAQVAHIDFVEAPRTRTVRDARTALIRRLGSQVLSRRLRRLIQRGDALFSDAHALMQPVVGRASIRQVVAEGEVAAWEMLTEQMLREQRRMVLHGVLGDELESAVTMLIAQAEAVAKQAAAMPAKALAMQINQSVTAGSPPMSPKQTLELVKRIAPTITTDEVSNAFRVQFGLDRGLLLAVMPEKASATVPTRDALRAVYERVMAEDLAPTEATARVTSILDAAPTPGTITSTVPYKELGVETWTLSNGIPVYVKPLASETNTAITFKLYGGLLHEDKATRGLTALADPALALGTAALANRSSEALSRYFEDKRVHVSTDRQADGITLSVTGAPEDIEPGLALVYGLLTQPVLEKSAFDNARSDYLRTIRDTRVEAQQALGAKMREVLGNGAARVRVPTEDHLNALTLDDARAWLKRLVSTSAMDVAIAGTFTPEQAKGWATTFMASLPERKESLATVRKARVATFGGMGVDARVELDTASPAAWVMQGWRGLRGRDVEEACAATVAANIFSTRLLQDIREARGIVYTISARYSVGRLDGIAHCASFFSAPHDKLALASETAQQLGIAYGGDHGPTDEELATVQKTILSSLEPRLERANYWAGVLAGSSVEPDGLTRVHKRIECMRAIDAAKVRAAAKTMFQPENWFQVMAGPKGALPSKNPVGAGATK